MKTIWKYPIKTIYRQEILMPPTSTILCVQVQGDEPCIWAEVDYQRQDHLNIEHIIYIYGTGGPLPDNPGQYIGTYQLDAGDLVFHVYEKQG